MAQRFKSITDEGLGKRGDNFDIVEKKKKRHLDEDCVILDGDPYKPHKVAKVSGVGSDEVVVLAEKGQIACRDYPHARHLCATFPFNSNPHDKYCGQCHCYVCDTRAPCPYWGTGLLSNDHCKATDKEKRWKEMRIRSKQGKLVQLSAPKHPAPRHSQPQNAEVHGVQLQTPKHPAPCNSQPRLPAPKHPAPRHSQPQNAVVHGVQQTLKHPASRHSQPQKAVVQGVQLPTSKHPAPRHSQPRTVMVQGDRLTVAVKCFSNSRGGRFSSDSNNVRARVDHCGSMTRSRVALRASSTLHRFQ